MQITLDQLKKVFPNTKSDVLETYLPHLNKAFAKYGFDTSNKVNTFLAQIGHESGEFKFVVENLNYSSDALRRVFPKYFRDKATADKYARKPQAIANRVYASRMGNGNEASGDGWKYRGKGLIQITGKNNHKGVADFYGKTIDEAVEWMLTPEGAVMSAVWFWLENGLMSLASVADMRGLTRKINGGTNGLQHRLELFERAKKVIRM